MNKGMEKRLNIRNAVVYSLRQARSESPRKNCVAATSDGARKNAKLRQNTLKVKMRCPQVDRNWPNPRDWMVPGDSFAAGKISRSRDRTTPGIPQKIQRARSAPA